MDRAYEEARQIDAEIAEITKGHQTGGTTKPMIVKETGKPATAEDGTIIYSSEPTEEYKRSADRLKVLEKRKSELFDEARKAGAKATGRSGYTKTEAPVAPVGTFSVSKAVAAGMSEADAKAKGARAAAAGWKVVQ